MSNSRLSREEFKILAYGQYAYLNIGQTIDRDRLDTYVQGALFVWDMINKPEVKKDPTGHPYYRPHHPNNPSNLDQEKS
jgi:hypothetical protein